MKRVTPLTMEAEWEKALRVVLVERDARAEQVFAELDAEREYSAKWRTAAGRISRLFGASLGLAIVLAVVAIWAVGTKCR